MLIQTCSRVAKEKKKESQCQWHHGSTEFDRIRNIYIDILSHLRIHIYLQNMYVWNSVGIQSGFVNVMHYIPVLLASHFPAASADHHSNWQLNFRILDPHASGGCKATSKVHGGNEQTFCLKKSSRNNFGSTWISNRTSLDTGKCKAEVVGVWLKIGRVCSFGFGA